MSDLVPIFTRILHHTIKFWQGSATYVTIDAALSFFIMLKYVATLGRRRQTIFYCRYCSTTMKTETTNILTGLRKLMQVMDSFFSYDKKLWMGQFIFIGLAPTPLTDPCLGSVPAAICILCAISVLFLLDFCMLHIPCCFFATSPGCRNRAKHANSRNRS